MNNETPDIAVIETTPTRFAFVKKHAKTIVVTTAVVAGVGYVVYKTKTSAEEIVEAAEEATEVLKTTANS